MRNVHERHVHASPDEAGALLESLGSADDQLWPAQSWAPMVLDRGLAIGSRGGHDRIRYAVTAHDAGRRVEFTFARTSGIDGTHAFSVEPQADGTAVLRHVLEGRAHGATRLLWPLAVRWAHDAVVEDAFDRAEAALGTGPQTPARWSPWVRLLRRGLSAAADPAAVREVPTPAELIAAAGLPRADVTDTFVLPLPPGSSRDVQDWHRALTTAGAPAWVGALMAARNRIARGLGLRTVGSGGDVPPFAALTSTADVVVVGVDDAHLDFRVVLRVLDDHLQLATVVHQHGLAGRAYFTVVQPFHRRIVPALLRRAARLGAPAARPSADSLG